MIKRLNQVNVHFLKRHSLTSHVFIDYCEPIIVNQKKTKNYKTYLEGIIGPHVSLFKDVSSDVSGIVLYVHTVAIFTSFSGNYDLEYYIYIHVHCHLRVHHSTICDKNIADTFFEF